MKKIIILFAMILSNAINGQVGVGTYSPEATIHVKNKNNQDNVMKLQGHDEQTKMIVKENGTIIISQPSENNSLNKILALDPNDNSIKLFDTSTITGTIIEPTGLERIDETQGDGWRLIGRNPLNYGNIGLGAVDFSHSIGASSVNGANSKYSLIGPSLNNSITGNVNNPDNTVHVILGGNNNKISNGANLTANTATTILGSHNEVIVGNSLGFHNFVSGFRNEILRYSSGNIIGNKNTIGQFNGLDTTEFGNNTIFGTIIGSASSIRGGNGILIGEGNNIFNGKNIYILGAGNTVDNTIGNNILIGQACSSTINNEMILGYFPTISTLDNSFRVGIGSSSVDRKDGFTIRKNGKVIVNQTPATNNSLTSIYARDSEGAFALIDKSSLLDLLRYDESASINLNYLNTNYGNKPIGYQVYSSVDNVMYTKVNTGRWVKNSVTTVF